MIDLRQLEEYRRADLDQLMSHGRPIPRDKCGCFSIPSPIDGAMIRCIASAGGMVSDIQWDHVSVSRDDRCPSWEEMDFIYKKFFRANEDAMQLHVPDADHVNHHPYCLHIWRPTGLKKIPRPPSIMVGPDSAKGRRSWAT